jgi:hypothetical protein
VEGASVADHCARPAAELGRWTTTSIGVTQASDTLVKGAAIVSASLPGFRFEERAEGVGSGGAFAWGEFVRDDRRLELHFRRSLGLVTYHLGNHALSHEGYLRAMGVPPGANQYPGFSDDPLDGFRHLAHDLRAFVSEFVRGDAVTLQRAAPEEMAHATAAWERTKAAYEGDDRVRAEAWTHFRAGDYDRVVSALAALRYPQFLPESERRMLEIARRRTVD